MNRGEVLLRRLFSDRRIADGARLAMRRGGPVAGAILLNALLVAGFAMASVTSKLVTPSIGQPPEPMAVTLVLTDFIPPPPRVRPAPQTSTPSDAAGESIPTRRRKAKGPTTPAPTPDIDASPNASGDSGDASAALAPNDVPEGLRSLLEKPEPCGSTSERTARADCKGKYAKLVPPVDDWSLPDLKYYEARFGHVEGVEERHERFKKLFALMGKPAGAQDPMGQ
jgi:hypothetical protein